MSKRPGIVLLHNWDRASTTLLHLDGKLVEHVVKVQLSRGPCLQRRVDVNIDGFARQPVPGREDR